MSAKAQHQTALLDASGEPAINDTKDVQLVPKESPALGMFERLASDPNVDVDKFDRLLAMRERILAHEAKAEFDAEFAAMLPELPTIQEKGRTDKGQYARLEDIIPAVKPILARHGFALSFRTEWPGNGTVRIVGVLSHRNGHSRESAFEGEADKSGSKNSIQALGSTVSYGRRYTTNDLLCLVSSPDDDGHRSSAPSTPDGFDDWWDDLQALADEGIDALTKFWQQEYKAHKPLCAYVLEHRAKAWAALKDRAERATKAQKAEAAR